MAKRRLKGIISMKNIFKNMMLGSALVLCAAGTASANQLLVFITSAQIINAVGAANGFALGGGVTVGLATSFGANCSAGLTDCGVYGMGASTALAGSNTATVTGFSSPVPSGNAQWTTATFASTYHGYETAGSGTTPQEEFITANTHTVYSGGGQCTAITTAGCYSPASSLNPLGSIKLNGVAAMNATTNIGTMGFLLDFGSTFVAPSTAVNLNLDLFVAHIDAVTGLQDTTKSTSSTLTLNGLTTQALPEPASVATALSGILALGLAGWRRRRQVQASAQNLS